MTREQALPYIAHYMDDTGSERQAPGMPANARLVGWQCGFEPLFIAVWSYLDVRLDDDEAVNLATNWLEEKDWFANGPTEPDYVI